jgi:hypothetical protein
MEFSQVAGLRLQLTIKLKNSAINMSLAVIEPEKQEFLRKILK